MINATKTKETLEAMLSDHTDFSWYESRAIHDAISILNNEEWISVKDYLPIRNGNYLVTVESVDQGRRSQRCSTFYRSDLDDPGEWRVENTQNWVVIAWKPLTPYYMER